MSCRDDSLNLRQPSDLKKLVDAHNYIQGHYDKLGQNAEIARYYCHDCGKEWTTMLIHKNDLR